MPLRNFFIRICEREHFSFGEPRTGNHQSDRKSVFRKTTWDRDGGQSEYVERRAV